MYCIERRVLEAAPQLGPDDLISMADARRELGVAFSSLYGYMLSGKLTPIVEMRPKGKRMRRWVLRSELDSLLRDRQERAGDSSGELKE